MSHTIPGIATVNPAPNSYAPDHAAAVTPRSHPEAEALRAALVGWRYLITRRQPTELVRLRQRHGAAVRAFEAHLSARHQKSTPALSNSP